MPALHSPQLRGGPLHLPPRRRHLLWNGVPTLGPRPFLRRNWGPRSNWRRHPHRRTPRLLVQQPPRPSIHNDDGWGAEKVQTCRPANFRKLDCGLCHVLYPPRQLINQQSSIAGCKDKGGTNMEGLEGNLQPPQQKYWTQDTLGEGVGFLRHSSLCPTHTRHQPHHSPCPVQRRNTPSPLGREPSQRFRRTLQPLCHRRHVQQRYFTRESQPAHQVLHQPSQRDQKNPSRA